MSIDVEGLKARHDIVAVIGQYITLKKRGAEFVGICPFHDDSDPSLTVNQQKRIFKCFVCGVGGDVIDFVREYEGLAFVEAAEKLGAVDKFHTRAPIEHERAPKLPDRITSKPPVDAPGPNFTLRDLGEPSKTYAIRDLDGSLIAYECRYETSGKKEIRIWSWGSRGTQAPGWGIGHLNVQRPIYGLERLSVRTNVPILITEGPKKADAGAKLLDGYYRSVAWTGGANAWHKHDWTPLKAQAVLILPDADAPGIEAANKLAAILADPRGHNCRVRIVDTSSQPDGWDIADALAEGWTTEQFIEWARPLARDYVHQAAAVEPPPSPLPPVDAYQEDAAQGDGDDDEEMPLPASMSEDFIADAFAREIERDWRYVSQWNAWLEWDGSTWRKDKKEFIDRKAVEMCRRVLTWKEAQQIPPQSRLRLGQKRTAGAVRDLARSDRRIAATPDGWDADPLLVGIPGGVFDVRVGKVIESERMQYITKRTACAPAPGTPKRWIEHLKRMMNGDESMIRFLQLYAGYCATGETREQCFIFLYGMGQTGKGTFLLTVHDLLGDYASMSSASTFMSTGQEKHTSEIARLSGCRMVVVDETDGTARWNEERLKRMTGGGRITAALKYRDEEDIQVSWKLAFAGNHKPALRGVGKEMERRIRLVKCTASIPDGQVDRRFRERMIAEEGPQILNWILEGAVLWNELGLPLPEAISDATRDYLTSEDVIGDWIAECCDEVPGNECDRPQAYRTYATWAEKRGDRAWSNRAWWSAMEDRGYRARKTDGLWRVVGLVIKASAPSESYAPQYYDR